jgi:hypothetical protein
MLTQLPSNTSVDTANENLQNILHLRRKIGRGHRETNLDIVNPYKAAGYAVWALHSEKIASYSKHRVPIRLADNSVIYSEGIGSVEFQPEGNVQPVVFHDTLHVPRVGVDFTS